MASFRKRGSKWEYRVTKDGQTISKGGFRTKSAAQTAALELELSLEKGTYNNKNYTFAEYFKLWYETYKKGKLSVHTDAHYTQVMKYVKTFFGDMYLKNITRVIYQTFINEYSKTRKSSSVRKLHSACKACLQEAVIDNLIPFNPAYKVTIKGVEKQTNDREKYLNEKELKKLLDYSVKHLNDDIAYHIIIIASLTGLRIGEIFALSVDDVNFKNKTVTVNKGYDYTYTFDFTPAKNKNSHRTIILPQLALDIFNDLKDKNPSQHYYFLTDSLKPLRSKDTINIRIKDICRKLNINPISIHKLRHTHGSILMFNNVNIKYISMRLGHADIKMTLSTYSHIINEMEQIQNEKVTDIFNNLLE